MNISAEKNILVIGGCRSGKSSHALKLADQFSGSGRIFIATCIPYDDEMRERVTRHQEERDNTWKTVEEPLNLPEAIAAHGNSVDLILVDCITLWVSNLLLKNSRIDYILENVRRLTSALNKTKASVIMVSNEVGTGIVPENRIARRFRDAAGFANQHIAAAADRVVWMVAGIPVNIK